ncbi:MAG: ATP-binding protein [Bacteroidaceae bacterium]|nr:ATP-binding protein [Bacteroidaceae bacterium]
MKATTISTTLPVSSIENNRFIVVYDNKKFGIRLHPSQKNIKEISELPCIVTTDENGNVTIRQNFKSKLSELYRKDSIKDFIVKRDYRPNGSDYVEIIDKYGFTTYLQKLNTTKPFINGQKIKCRIMGITTSRPIVKYFSDGYSSDTEINAQYIERLILQQNADTAEADKEETPSWDVRTFANMLLSNENHGSFNAECHQWVLDIAKESESKPGLLPAIREQCKNLLERSELLKNCSSDTERDFFQNRITFIIERIGYFVEARKMLSDSENEDKDIASEFVDSILEKLRCSGFIYHPNKNFSIMTCLFLLYPELMQEKIKNIFEILSTDFHLWLREPFRTEFIKQLEFFISVTIPTISPAETRNQTVENAVSALALQLLLAKDDSDDELLDIDVNRSAFLRLSSHLLEKDTDIKALLTGAFMSLIGVRTIGKFYNEGQTTNPVVLANFTVNNKGIQNISETPPNVEFTGAGVVMTYDKDGFRFFPANAAEISENVLPEGLLDWNKFRVCIPDKKRAKLKNIKDIYQYHQLWNDIELGLFSPHNASAKTENKKQTAWVGAEVKIMMTHQDLKDSNKFYCRIIDDKYTGEGFIYVQCKSKNKSKYGIVGYDPKPNIHSFINNNGHPMLLDVEVVEKHEDGTLEFSMREKINEVMMDVEYPETIECSVGLKAPNVKTYPAVSFMGESISIDGIPKDITLKPNDIVEVAPRKFEGGYVHTTFVRKVEGKDFDINDAFRELMIFYSDDAEYIDPDSFIDTDESESLDVIIPPKHMTELIAIIDRLSVLDNDYVKAYNYLGIAVILARMMGNDAQVNYFKKRMEMILLLHDFAMNDSIDEERLNKIKDIDSNLFENFSFLKTRLMQLQIVNCNGSNSPEAKLYLWEIINSDDYKDLHKLASCVLAHNLMYHNNLPDIAEVIHTEMKRLLNLKGEMSEKKYYGKEDLYTEFKMSLVIPENTTKYDAKAQTHKILEEICAMLNAKGGHLYLGVNDMGIGNGIADDLKYEAFKGSTDKYIVYLNNNISYYLGERADRYCNVTEDTYNGFTVIDIAIRPAKEPVSLDDEYYERRGTSSRKVKDTDIFFSDFKEDREAMAQNIADEVYENDDSDDNDEPVQTPPTSDDNDTRVNTHKNTEVEKVATSQWRNNVLHDYEDNYRNDVVAYIYFMDNDNFKLVEDDTWEEDTARLALVIHEDEQSEYLIMVYDDGTVNKVDMEELLERRKDTLYKYANDKTLVFACPARNDDALMIENKAKNGTTYLRVDDIAAINESKITSPGTMTTEIELGQILRCEIIPEDMKQGINLNFSKKSYGFFENTEDGKTVIQVLNRLYERNEE